MGKEFVSTGFSAPWLKVIADKSKFIKCSDVFVKH